jgi:clathrin heavy chain
VSKKHDILYIATKMGYVYLYDVHTGNVIFRHRVSASPVFVTVLHEATGGLMCVTAKTGEVILVTINPNNLVHYVADTLHNRALAMTLAGRLGVDGASSMYQEEFVRVLSSGDVDTAISLAASSPGGSLRTADTIRRLQEVPAVEGQQPALLRYFAALMEKGKLNKVRRCRPSRCQRRVCMTGWRCRVCRGAD